MDFGLKRLWTWLRRGYRRYRSFQYCIVLYCIVYVCVCVCLCLCVSVCLSISLSFSPPLSFLLSFSPGNRILQTWTSDRSFESPLTWLLIDCSEPKEDFVHEKEEKKKRLSSHLSSVAVDQSSKSFINSFFWWHNPFTTIHTGRTTLAWETHACKGEYVLERWKRLGFFLSEPVTMRFCKQNSSCLQSNRNTHPKPLPSPRLQFLVCDTDVAL